MTFQAKNDFSALRWAKPELDQTLVRVRAELESHVEQMADPAALRAMLEGLCQVLGVLRMLGLHALALVIAEMESLLQALLESRLEPSEDAYGVLLRGLMQVPDYLERLVIGYRDVPLGLLPLLNELRAVQRLPLFDEAVLFDADLERKPPPEASQAEDAGVDLHQFRPCAEGEPAMSPDPLAQQAGFQASDEDIDSDIREIFLEELGELIEILRAGEREWLADVADLEKLGAMRRAFHTLKGSGRLVGAQVLGEFAWQVEDLLNQVLERTVEPDQHVQMVIHHAILALPELQDALRNDSHPQAPLSAIMEAAERLARGDAAVFEGPLGVLLQRQAAHDPVLLPEAVAPIHESTAESLPVELPAATPPTTAGPLLPSIDAELLGILRGEVGQYLQTIHTVLAVHQGGDLEVGDELWRAVHTLHGAIGMAEILPLLELLSPLEIYLKRLRTARQVMPAEAQALLTQAADVIEQVMSQLEVSSPRLPDIATLVAGIVELRNSVPEVQAQPASDELAVDQQLSGLLENSLLPEFPERVDDDPVEGEVDAALIAIFVEEASELLDHADVVLAQWQQDPSGAEHRAALLRDLHTLKGGARIAGLMPLGDLAHAIETVLEQANDSTDAARLMGALERGLDGMHALVVQVASAQPLHHPQEMIEGLFSPIMDPLSATPEVSVAPAGSVRQEAIPIAEVVESIEDDLESSEHRAGQEQIRVRAELLDSLVYHAGEVAIYRSRLEQQVAAYRSNLIELDSTVTRLRSQLRQLEIETEAHVIARYQQEHGGNTAALFDPLELDRYSQLQQYSRALAESVSDLVSIQGTLGELTRQAESLLIHQSRVSGELQEGLLRTRMLPFGTLVPSLRRTVRQTAGEQHKLARLQVEGAQGEMDRSLLERLKAPFEHMLRNAVVHGIESPEGRRLAGKPKEGVLHIKVAREATEVVIRVCDDGRGLAREEIRRRAIERGWLHVDDRLDDERLLELIIQAGFSTAESVTQLAGRGVGMDVVANEIKQLGGTLAIESSSGQGTTFVLRLPFTLSVTQTLLVRIGETPFAIPMSSVTGVVQVGREMLRAQLLSSDPVLPYDGIHYGLYSLAELIGQPVNYGADEDRFPVILVRAGDFNAAIQVDAVIGSNEIVVKSAGVQVNSIPGVLGATIMGNGGVVIILDPAPLIRHTLRRREQRLLAGEQPVEMMPVEAPVSVQKLIMVVDDSVTMRKVTGRVLERHDFDVITAKDGVDALEKLAERIPDLMLIDIEMPRMDGYELVTQMNADPRLSAVPMIMITSRSGEKHKQRAFDLGVRRYLGKPYREADLLKNIEEVLYCDRKESAP